MDIDVPGCCGVVSGEDTWMTIGLQLLLVLIVAMLFSAILIYVFGRRGPGPASGFLFFLVIFFLTIWAGSVWIEPIGPIVWGVPLLVTLIVGLVILLLIVVASVPMSAEPVAPDQEAVLPSEGAGWGCGVLFWVLMAVLIIAAVARYTWFPTPLIGE